MSSARWNQDFFPVPGNHTFDNLLQKVTAISRGPNNLDLFIIGKDNKVWTTYFPNQEGLWNPEWFPIPGNHTFRQEFQRIAAIARTPNNLDLFVIGNDNKVYTNFFPNNGAWDSEWRPIPGLHTFDHQKQEIVAVSRHQDVIDLFVIGLDNHVWTTFWTREDGWHSEWFPIPGLHTFSQDYQRIAAVARTPNNLDLFVIGFDNHVWTNFYPNQEGNWNNEWVTIPGAHTFDHVTQRIAAVSRTQTNLDLFVVGLDNHVWTTFWPVENGNWNHEWFPVPGLHTFDHQRQHVAAVSRAPGNLDLFIVGLDNHVWSTFWPNAQNAWNGEWFALPGIHTFDKDRQQIEAVARTPGNLDIFVVGFDDHVWTSFATEEVALQYVGFRCDSETSGPGSDEPYFTFGVVPLDVAHKATAQTRIYEDVDAGRVQSDLIEIYRGRPLGTALTITLVENDQGDPNIYRGQVEKLVRSAESPITSALEKVPTVGPVLKVLGAILLDIAIPEVTNLINNLLDTGDDLVGTILMGIGPEEMLTLAHAPRTDFGGIQAHLQSPPITGDDGFYRVYFDLVPA